MADFFIGDTVLYKEGDCLFVDKIDGIVLANGEKYIYINGTQFKRKDLKHVTVIERKRNEVAK